MTTLLRHVMFLASLACSATVAATEIAPDASPPRFALQAELVEAPAAEAASRFTLQPARATARPDPAPGRFSLVGEAGKASAECAPPGTLFRDGFED